MKRPIIRFLLFVLFFFGSVSLVNGLCDVVFLIASRSGSRGLALWLRSGSFSLGLIKGLLAGLIPIEQLFVITGGTQPRLVLLIRRLKPEKLKPWMGILAALFLAIPTIEWTIRWIQVYQQQTSIFGTTFKPVFRDFIASYFSSSCFDNVTWNWSFWGSYETCLSHRVFLWAGALTAGYAMAPLVVSRLIPAVYGTRAEVGQVGSDPTEEKSTMERKIDSQ